MPNIAGRHVRITEEREVKERRGHRKREANMSVELKLGRASVGVTCNEGGGRTYEEATL